MPGRAPGDLRSMSTNWSIAIGSPSGDLAATRRSSHNHRQMFTPPPPNMGAGIKVGHLASPIISAVVTMLRRHEFERQLAHFNILCGVAAIVIVEEEEQARRRRRKREEQATRRRRRWWVRPWLARRPIYGHYEQLMNELLRENHTDFKNFLRVEPEMFFELVERVGPRIQKNTR